MLYPLYKSIDQYKHEKKNTQTQTQTNASKQNYNTPKVWQERVF